MEQIHDVELCLYDVNPPSFGGLHDEYVFSARLDNLGMSYCALMALLESSANYGNSFCSTSLEEEECVRMVLLFDNEEVGSQSAYGAGSNVLQSTMHRIHAAVNQDQARNLVYLVFINSCRPRTMNKGYTKVSLLVPTWLMRCIQTTGFSF